MALRNDYAAGLYRSPDGVSNWSLVGRTLGQVEAIRATAINGTYVIEADGTNDFFVPNEVWTATTPDGQTPEVLQRSTQIVRPETNVSKTFEKRLAPVAVSEDGQCVAYSGDTSTAALNTMTGRTWSLGDPYYSFGWVE